MRVLVIEDEVRMARLLKRALEEENHTVDVAGDGPDGLWMATENTYAAIVLDVMLPGFDGFELCRRIREAGIWVPVLMLTARAEVGDRVRGLAPGAAAPGCVVWLGWGVPSPCPAPTEGGGGPAPSFSCPRRSSRCSSSSCAI